MLGSAVSPFEDDHDEKFGVPSLEELGFDCDHLKPPVWVGGESEALSRLERHLERKAWVASFGRPKMTPQSLLASPTGLSPYLRFGCLSTRLFYHALSDLYRKVSVVQNIYGQRFILKMFRLKSVILPCLSTVSFCGESSSIVRRPEIQTLTKWSAIKFVFR